MAIVFLPGLVKKFSPDSLTCRVPGETVAEVLRNLSALIPELESRLFKENGDLRALYVVLVDSKDIRMLQGAETPVQDDTEVKLLAALAGG